MKPKRGEQDEDKVLDPPDVAQLDKVVDAKQATARRNALYATCMRELPSPLKTLANAMSDSGRFVV